MRSNTGLTITLSDVLRELSEKQEQSDATVVEYRNAVDCARTTLQAAKHRKQRAIYEDEQLKKKQKDIQTRWKEISEQIQRVNKTTYKTAKL